MNCADSGRGPLTCDSHNLLYGAEQRVIQPRGEREEMWAMRAAVQSSCTSCLKNNSQAVSRPTATY